MYYKTLQPTYRLVVVVDEEPAPPAAVVDFFLIWPWAMVGGEFLVEGGKKGVWGGREGWRKEMKKCDT